MRMRWVGHIAHMGEMRKAYKTLVGKPEGKRPLGRPRHRCSVVRTGTMTCVMITHRFKQFLPVHLHLQLLVIVLLVILSYFMVKEILLVLEGL
jgi:hypothetical protein